VTAEYRQLGGRAA